MNKKAYITVTHLILALGMIIAISLLAFAHIISGEAAIVSIMAAGGITSSASVASSRILWGPLIEALDQLGHAAKASDNGLPPKITTKV